MGTITFSPETIHQAARSLIRRIGHHTVVAFYGEMGVGKTTLIRAICQEWGVEDPINSPTFAIVNEYLNRKTGQPVYHFDFYRIHDPSEAQTLGLEDYFYSGAICLLEWPEKVEALLLENTLRITLSENEDGTREVKVEKPSRS